MQNDLEEPVSPTTFAAQAWQEFKKHMPFWVVLSVFVAIPTTIFEILLTRTFNGETDQEIANNFESILNDITPDQIMMFGMLFIMLMLFSVLMYSTQIASFLYIAKNKKQLDIVTAFSMGLKHYFGVFVVSLLLGLVIVGGLLLFIVPGIMFALWYSFVVQIKIDENKSIKEVFTTSKQLYKSNRRIVLLTFLLIFGVSLIASYGVAVTTTIIELVSPSLSIVSSGVLSAFIGMYTGFLAVQLYLHIKSNASADQ